MVLTERHCSFFIIYFLAEHEEHVHAHHKRTSLASTKLIEYLIKYDDTHRPPPRPREEVREQTMSQHQHHISISFIIHHIYNNNDI